MRWFEDLLCHVLNFALPYSTFIVYRLTKMYNKIHETGLRFVFYYRSPYKELAGKSQYVRTAMCGLIKVVNVIGPAYLKTFSFQRIVFKKG